MEGSLKAVFLGLIAAVDGMAQDVTPRARVLTWVGSLLIGAFGVGVGTASWVGLPGDVKSNNAAIETLADNQREIVRLIVSQECDRRGLTNRECRDLQRRRIRRLGSGGQPEGGN